MAVYIASLMPRTAAPQPQCRGTRGRHRTAVFAGACGGCHAADAPMTRDGAPSLALSSAVNAPTPRGVIQIILHGIPWRDGQTGPYMPSFADALTDAQVAELAA